MKRMTRIWIAVFWLGVIIGSLVYLNRPTEPKQIDRALFASSVDTNVPREITIVVTNKEQVDEVYKLVVSANPRFNPDQKFSPPAPDTFGRLHHLDARASASAG